MPLFPFLTLGLYCYLTFYTTSIHLAALCRWASLSQALRVLPTEITPWPPGGICPNGSQGEAGTCPEKGGVGGGGGQDSWVLFLAVTDPVLLCHHRGSPATAPPFGSDPCGISWFASRFGSLQDGNERFSCSWHCASTPAKSCTSGTSRCTAGHPLPLNTLNQNN